MKNNTQQFHMKKLYFSHENIIWGRGLLSLGGINPCFSGRWSRRVPFVNLSFPSLYATKTRKSIKILSKKRHFFGVQNYNFIKYLQRTI